MSNHVARTASDVILAGPAPPPRAMCAWRAPRASLIVLAAGLLAYTGSRLLPLFPGTRERAYGAGPGAVLSRMLSQLTGSVPFSVAEILLTAYVAYLLLVITVTLHRIGARRGTWRAALRGGSLRLARHVGIALVSFYLLWGMNYTRPPFAIQAGWQRWDGIESDELNVLLEQATRTANRAYLALHGSADAGEPTAMPTDLRALDQAIDEGWRRAAQRLPLPRATARSYGAVKWPNVSPLLARFGISGMYVPFTGEANVVRHIPAARAPMAMAHEKAHQRGVAREGDASFLGYVAASLAPDPLARYAAAMFARQQLFNVAYRRLPAAEIRRIRNISSRGVHRDVSSIIAFWRHYDDFKIDIPLNNLFLQANGIEGGVEDYGRSVFLIIHWARQNGGDFLP